MRPKSKGAGRLKAIISLLFLAWVVYAAIKVIPAYVDNYELSDYIQSQNPYWLTQRAPAEAIQTAILSKAQSLSLPVTADDVKLNVTSGHVAVAVDYAVPFNLLFFTLSHHFHISAENNRL